MPGTVALVCMIIGTTSFDGFSGGPAWGNIAPELTTCFATSGFGQATALELAFTVGLLAVGADRRRPVPARRHGDAVRRPA